MSHPLNALRLRSRHRGPLVAAAGCRGPVPPVARTSCARAVMPPASLRSAFPTIAARVCSLRRRASPGGAIVAHRGAGLSRSLGLTDETHLLAWWQAGRRPGSSLTPRSCSFQTDYSRQEWRSAPRRRHLHVARDRFPTSTTCVHDEFMPPCGPGGARTHAGVMGVDRRAGDRLSGRCRGLPRRRSRRSQ